MKTLRRNRFALAALVVLLILGGPVGARSGQMPAAQAGKIDPYLAAILGSNPDGNVAVIVKGAGSAALKSAVERHGGQVIADLWLIDSVAALLRAEQVAALAAEPAVLSLSPDKPVQKASGAGDRVAPNRLNGTFAPGAAVDLDPLVDRAGNAYLFANHAGTYKVHRIGPDGAALWSYILGSGSKFRPVGGALAPNGEFIAATAENGLFALKPAGTGATLSWSYGGTSLKLAAAPLVAADGVVYFSAQKSAFALTPTGDLKWQRPLGKDTSALPPFAVPGGVLFLTGPTGKFNQAVFFGANNSSWTWSSSDEALEAPAVTAEGRLLFAEGSAVVALDPATGAVVWRSPDLGGGVVDAPLATSSGVAALVAGLGLRGLQGASGAVVWSAPLPGVNSATRAAVAAGRYLGVGAGNTFHVVDATNGGAAGVPYILDAGNDVRSLAAAGNGFFYAYTTKNRFLLLAQDASLYWSYSLFVAGGESKPRQKGKDRDEDKPSLASAPTTGSAMALAQNGTAFVVDGADNLNVLGALPEVVDEATPDVQEVDLASNRMKLAYSAAIDTGADLVYRKGVTGRGVTIALIDSGVYYDVATRQYDTRTQYAGQVDFVDGGANPVPVLYSTDPYGHGSHVASVILNPHVDQLTNTYIGVAPDARLVSVRVLDGLGQGSYSTVIAGLQWVVQNRSQYNIRVANYSIVARATAPYWADPLNVAAQRVWQSGIVLVAAAGNDGPSALSVAVPANSPYVIAVGALSGNRTAGRWGDDRLSSFSAAGPTLDGFVKPDLVAPGSRIVGFMRGSGAAAAYLASVHPDAAAGYDFFRMSGTSQATAMVSGIAALVLQQHPGLTPDQVKYRLMTSARPFVTEQGTAPYSIFQQGTGRVWAPAAVFASGESLSANAGLSLDADVGPAGGANLGIYSSTQYTDPMWRALHPQVRHFQGPVVFDGAAARFTVPNVPDPTADGSYLSWSGGWTNWAGGWTNWAGGWTNWAGGWTNWAGGWTNWAGGWTNWAGGWTNWAGGWTNWAGGYTNWAGGYTNWAGGWTNWAGGYTNWAGSYADPRFAAAFASCANVPAGTSSASVLDWVNDRP